MTHFPDATTRGVRGLIARGALAVVLAGCGAAAGTSTVAPTAAPQAPGRGPATATATDADSGHTLTVRSGDHVVVVLASTYWGFQPAADLAVLALDPTPVYSPAPGCIPGGGCGTASARYTALAPGTTRLTASRTSCGEAMGCVGDSGRYALTVVVQP